MSKDGGPSYPPDYAGTLPASVPATPWAVPVYDVGTCTGRMLRESAATLYVLLHRRCLA